MLGNRLSQLRKEKGITQVKLAQYFGISNGTIAMWETDKRQPDSDTLIKLADFFNVSVDYLLGRPETYINSTDSELNHLISIWHSLSTTSKLRLVAYADGLRDNY